uniref:Acyltransferase 3 domain-containing protein n=1 Tax=Anopheles dirus TaxID=7168 RepID=A0A182N9Y4_9DIPT
MAETDSTLHRDLLYIDGLRVVINHLVIVLHTFLIASAAPAKNYDDLEKLVNNPPMLIYLSSNAFLVQTFFTIGGFLLSVNFLRDTIRGPINFRYVGNKILNRLLRLLPVYGFFLLFSVSVNVRFDVNMNGFRLFTAENAICRQNWWSNLFFVNNFMWPAELCLMHTWYLATDLQLFLMAMALLLLVHRWPKGVGIVFLLGVAASFAIPGYITHQHNMHPVLPIKLSEVKFMFMYVPWLRRLYLPSYANTGCYLYGIIAGYLYHWVTNNKLQLQRSLLYRTVDRCVTPTLVGVVLSTYLWYVVEVPKPALWVSIYSAFYRNIIGIFVAVCFLRSINSPPGFVRRMLSSKLLTTLGKLTYSVYVLHDVVMRFVLLNERIGSDISLQKFVFCVYLVTVVSFAAGLVVFLVIEQPMILLLKPHINRYHRMPKLWQMDDYDECLSATGPDEPADVYCTATVVLKPDNRSDLWTLIEEFSSDYKRHFNHRVLKRGVCIKRCQQSVAKLAPPERKALLVEKFPINETYKFEDNIFENTALDREIYEDVVELCINKELNETYGLVAFAEIQSCDKSTSEVKIDTLDMSFLIVLCLLISLVILSSWYDSSINYKLSSEHYKHELDSKLYAFVVLLHATWLLKLQTGPLWRWGAETEQVFCRRNWWTNLLYVNNYVNPNQPCVQQGWYLGAEFQIFIIALIVLVAIVKFPRAKIALLTFVIGAAYVVPAFFIYHQRLQGTFVVTLEAQRYILWYDKFYLQAYIPTHINFGNYMLGVLTGLIYHELRKRSVDLASSGVFRFVWYANFLVVPLSMLPSYVFYVNEFETPSVWMAIYFAVSKNFFGIGIGIMILGCVHGVSGVLQRVLNYPFFEPMGRLAYGAYLIHPFVMRYMFVSTRGPVYYSDTLTISLVLGATAMSCLVSLLLCLLIELPTSALQNHLFAGFK